MSGSPLEIAFDFARAIIALFIIVDPFGDIPIFITLTEKMAKGEKRRVFNTATIVGLVLLLVFSLTGQEIFAIFGISVYAFEVAGGILLLIIAIRILISGSMQEKDRIPRKPWRCTHSHASPRRPRSHYYHDIKPATVRSSHGSWRSYSCGVHNLDHFKIHGFDLSSLRQNGISDYRQSRGLADRGDCYSIHLGRNNTLLNYGSLASLLVAHLIM